MGDIMEESDWELNSVVAMATGENRPPVKGSSQAEKEIRYSLVSCSVVEMPIIQLKSMLLVYMYMCVLSTVQLFVRQN